MLDWLLDWVELNGLNEMCVVLGGVSGGVDGNAGVHATTAEVNAVCAGAPTMTARAGAIGARAGTMCAEAWGMSATAMLEQVQWMPEWIENESWMDAVVAAVVLHTIF